MRSAAVLMAGLTLLVAGVLVLALSGAVLLGVVLVVVGVLTKIGGFLVGSEPTHTVGPGGMRAIGPAGGTGGRSRSGGTPAGVTTSAPTGSVLYPARPRPASCPTHRRAS